MEFKIISRSFGIEIDDDKFIALSDSESYVTDYAIYKDGNSSLFDKLNKMPEVNNIEYNGHYGSCIYLTLNVEDDTPELRNQILEIIDNHLQWCSTLEIREDVKRRRCL